MFTATGGTLSPWLFLPAAFTYNSGVSAIRAWHTVYAGLAFPQNGMREWPLTFTSDTIVFPMYLNL